MDKFPKRNIKIPRTFFIDANGKVKFEAIYLSDLKHYLDKVMKWTQEKAPYNEDEITGARCVLLDIMHDLGLTSPSSEQQDKEEVK